MSAFDNSAKDRVVDEIERFANIERENGKSIIEIVGSILSVSTYSIMLVLYDLLEDEESDENEIR